MSTVLEVPLGAALTEEEARRIFALGEEAVVFALLQLSKAAAEARASQAATDQEAPSVPSGMKAPYHKAPAGRGKKKPGRQAGHPGARRPRPTRGDDRQEHRAPCCPE